MSPPAVAARASALPSAVSPANDFTPPKPAVPAAPRAPLIGPRRAFSALNLWTAPASRRRRRAAPHPRASSRARRRRCQPDHLHALWTLPEGDANFSTRWRLIKEGFTRGYLKTHEHPQRSESRRAIGEQGIWQRRFCEHAIRDDADFAAHLDYIHINPVKHVLVTAARDWPYSTFPDCVASAGYVQWWGSDEMPRLPVWVGHG